MGIVKKTKSLRNYLAVSLPILKVLPFPYRIFRFYYVFDMLNALIRHGISPMEYMELGFWEVPSYKRSEYLTERILLSADFIDHFYTKESFNLITNKRDFNIKYSNFLYRDWLFTQDCDDDTIREFMQKQNKVIIKPLLESRGIGIRILDKSYADWVIDEKHKGVFYMIEQILCNHHVLKELNETSLQTLRVETVIDKNGKCHIINCCLFVGGDRSVVSNAHGGGTTWHVNMQTGIVDSDGFSVDGRSVSKLKNGENVRGIHIPYFEDLNNFIAKVALVTPEARYIGWDVAVLEDGLALIEGNVQPGVCTQRVDGIPKRPILESYA